MIHIYCGDGKGKTTAALGLSLRAAGSGMKVHFIQFLKGGETSELQSLKKIPLITVERCDQKYGFIGAMHEEEKERLTICHNLLLFHAKERLEQGETDLLVLDELNAAYEYGLCDRKAAEELILNFPKERELVLTGRNPLGKFVEAADYVSEIRAVKHPFEKGMAARKGIEF